MRIVFAGTPDFAADILAAIIKDRPEQVVAVYCQPDRPRGRGKKLEAPPVKTVALEHGLAVEQPVSLRNPDAVKQLAAWSPDLMIVAAYGLILPANVLTIPVHGCINVHASLLPRWRGAAPIERAIEAGDDQTGVTIMQMDAGLDTGGMLLARHCPITAADTAESLRQRLTEIGIEALLTVLNKLDSNLLKTEPQNDAEACYAAKLARAEAIINWHDPAAVIERRIRAFFPTNTCQTWVQGERLNVLAARLGSGPTNQPPGTILVADKAGVLVACGDGHTLSLQKLQLAGGKPMDVSAMLNGRAHMFSPLSRLGAGPDSHG